MDLEDGIAEWSRARLKITEFAPERSTLSARFKELLPQSRVSFPSLVSLCNDTAFGELLRFIGVWIAFFLGHGQAAPNELG